MTMPGILLTASRLGTDRGRRRREERRRRAARSRSRRWARSSRGARCAGADARVRSASSASADAAGFAGAGCGALRARRRPRARRPWPCSSAIARRSSDVAPRAVAERVLRRRWTVAESAAAVGADEPRWNGGSGINPGVRVPRPWRGSSARAPKAIERAQPDVPRQVEHLAHALGVDALEEDAGRGLVAVGQHHRVDDEGRDPDDAGDLRRPSP